VDPENDTPANLASYAENVGADGVHLVVGREPAIGILSPEHVEVVEPEVRHDRLQLARTMDRADDLLGLEVLQDLLGSVGCRTLLQLARLRRPRIVFEEFGCAHPD